MAVTTDRPASYRNAIKFPYNPPFEPITDHQFKPDTAWYNQGGSVCAVCCDLAHKHVSNMASAMVTGIYGVKPRRRR
jgi:hypothetical protein